MSESQRPKRAELTLERFIDITFSNLCVFYIQENPGETSDDFREKCLKPLISADNISGDDCTEFIKKIQKEDDKANLKFGPFFISMAYCIQAKRELDNKNRENAWSYMVDARYYCGVTIASKGIEKARINTIIATRKDTASRGGEARANKFQEIINEAYRLENEMRPQLNGWKSRSQAAKAILPKVQLYAAAMNLRLSPDQAKETIYKWLKQMPNATSIFPKK